KYVSGWRCKYGAAAKAICNTNAISIVLLFSDRDFIGAVEPRCSPSTKKERSCAVIHPRLTDLRVIAGTITKPKGGEVIPFAIGDDDGSGGDGVTCHLKFKGVPSRRIVGNNVKELAVFNKDGTSGSNDVVVGSQAR